MWKFLKGFAKDTLMGIIIDFVVKLLLIIVLVAAVIFGYNYYVGAKVEATKQEVILKAKAVKAKVAPVAADVRESVDNKLSALKTNYEEAKSSEEVKDLKKSATNLFNKWTTKSDE